MYYADLACNQYDIHIHVHSFDIKSPIFKRAALRLIHSMIGHLLAGV